MPQSIHLDHPIMDEDKSESSTCNDENFSTTSQSHDEQVPEIEARYLDDSILINIYCQMQKDTLSKLFNNIQSSNLTITNVNACPVGKYFDITIKAQVLYY